jgi:hypothetical protein
MIAAPALTPAKSLNRRQKLLFSGSWQQQHGWWIIAKLASADVRH